MQENNTTKILYSIVKNVLYIAIIACVIYGLIYVISSKPQISNEFKMKLDSLDRSITVLKTQQKSYDSAIHKAESEVELLNFQINGIKEKTTIIKEYYYEKSKAVDSFSHSQLDNFFAERYGY
jgi:hypothetical protein